MSNLPAPRIDLKQATVTLKDGTGTPNTLALKISEGDVTFQVQQEINYNRNRGVLDTVSEGDQQPMQLTFDTEFTEITSSTGLPVSVFEFLTFTGAASAYISTGANICDKPIAIDIEILLDRDCNTGGDTLQDELIVFPEFRFESINGSLNDGQFAVSGTCNAKYPTSTRSDPA